MADQSAPRLGSYFVELFLSAADEREPVLSEELWDCFLSKGAADVKKAEVDIVVWPTAVCEEAFDVDDFFRL